ncbi:MAG: TSUP family transporter [Deltaproteobacteria bacterium]|nr:TSUP family transporter [Deltaproteobacteria bacterium]MBK8234830.1 TSUP family transporter [Deltaproteobacteria bacterium]MBK8719850.1 TSUP family transporter [Deltaproteobacteria bacterium]MBP7285173.1 TSUP family transporter [Nannocystaceae bacterium]
MILLVVLGLAAGMLSTIAGLGGGLFLLMVLGLLRGPHAALVLTTPALLVSNLHRAWLFRADLDRRLARVIVGGVIPGAFLGALALPEIPETVVAVLFTASTVFALLRASGRITLQPRGRAIALYAFVVGALAATSGGAGMLLAPLVLSVVGPGTRYLATIAVGAMAMHAARVMGYGAAGLLASEQTGDILALLVGLLAGNLIGRRLRGHASIDTQRRVEIGALVIANVCALASLFGR